ncbi:MAG: biotin--[acetyl-CoA-carboxylase] ligase [Schleiferilactobacillus perolens]|uniref:biotin--[acetyl-CoA-carboxylase] ligase n=1 Tax=Schleiferilactobacillus perolens TaxID=100468 RepID=UPI0039EC74BD
MTLSAAVINAAQDVPVTVFATLPSTNRYAKDFAQHHSVSGAQAFIADTQTAGYGKRGRAFYSPSGSGLYLSLLVPAATVAPLAPGLLTTGAAVALVDALQPFFPETLFHVKWINDIIVQDRKCGGILVEQTHDAVVIGIGLNLFTAAFPESIQDKAGSLGTLPVDRNAIAAALLTQLMALLPQYHTGHFIPRYAQLSMVLGQLVTLTIGQTQVQGVARMIAPTGQLILSFPDGTSQAFSAGEVTKVDLPTANYGG